MRRSICKARQQQQQQFQNFTHLDLSVKMDRLPEEIVVKILAYLSPYRDFGSAQLVCHKWHRVIKTIVKSKQRDFRKAIISGDLVYTKLDCSSNRLRMGTGRCRLLSGIRSNRWSPSGSSYEPSPRFSHNSCVIGRFMYVFGGCSLSSTSSNSAFNDLHQFDLVEKTWQRITVNQGYMPAPRECSVMVAYGEKLVIFGGWCSPRSAEVTGIPKFFNDTSIVDIKNLTCMAVKSPDRDVPGTRAGHSACILNDRMIIFGGAQRILRYDDVWILDMISLHWYNPCINGKKPEGRFGHSQFPVGDRHIIIVGGCGGSNSLFDDLWLLNTITWQWTEINIENKLWQPPDVWCHPLEKVGDLLVTFSDQNVCNTCIGWHGNPLITSLLTGPLPVPSITCAQCQQNKVLKQNYDSHFQMYALDLNSLMKTWTVSWTCKPSFVPQSLSKSRSLFTISGGRNELLIFGGVLNMEKLKINNSPMTGVIVIKPR